MSNRSVQDRRAMPKMKPRIGQSVKDLVIKRTSNRSSDLQFLASQFDVVKIKLTQFIEALKGQYKILIEMNKTRLLVAEKVAALAVDSPLTEYAGTLSTEDRDDVTMSKLGSYLEIHQNLNLRRKMYTDRFLEHIIKYTVEWYSITSRKVNACLRKADKLRKELDHYESKVNRLNFDKGRVAKSGTGTDAYLNIHAKLERNENKMKMTKEAYEMSTAETTALIEELTLRCWQDLYPVLLKLTQFDVSLATDEQKLLKNLSAVTRSLTDMKQNYTFNPDTRLQNIENFESQYHMERSESRILMDLSGAEEQRDVVNGVQDHLRSRNSTQRTPLSTNGRKDNSTNSFFPPEIVTPRIRSFSGSEASGPKIEVDLSYDRNTGIAGNTENYASSPSPRNDGGRRSREGTPNKSRRTKQKSRSSPWRPSKGRSESMKRGLKKSDMPPKPTDRPFTGRPTDQNQGEVAADYSIRSPKYEGSVAGTSFLESHYDPFHELDDEETYTPLTPVARYR